MVSPATDTDTGKALISSFTPAVEPNLAEAVKWLRRAASQGHVEAKVMLEKALSKAEGIH